MNFKALLFASLIVNAALGYYAFRKPATAERPPAKPAIEQPAASPKEKAAKPRVVSQTITNTVVKTFNWQAVESPDYKEYIGNLRSIGCPEETIRDIILADVNKLYDQKKKLVRGGPKKFEFWKAGNPWMTSAEPEVVDKLRVLDEERTAFLRTLGIEPDFKQQAAQIFNPFETMMDFLPDEKKTQVLKAFADMQAKMAKLSKDGQPDGRDFQKLQKEMEASVKQGLTPEEALQFDLRFSMTANSMRAQVSGFEPSEQEFMAIYKVRKAFDDEFSPMSRGDESEDERKKRQEAENQLKEQIKQTLGDARYKDYELAQDWQFQQMLRAAKRADLGTAEARQVWDMKKVAEEQASNVRNDRNLTEEQRSAALASIQQETEKSVKGALGEKGWDQYNRGNNNWWLKNLNPQSPRAPQAKPTATKP